MYKKYITNVCLSICSFPESFEILSKMPVLASMSNILCKPQQTETQEEERPTLLSLLINLEDSQNLVREAETLLAELSQVVEIFFY